MHATIITALAGMADAPIPYSQEDAVSGWLIIKVLLVTAILLAVTYGALLVMKRKNLLPGSVQRKDTILEVVESRRLSARTTIHLVRTGKDLTLISESSANVEMRPLPSSEAQP